MPECYVPDRYILDPRPDLRPDLRADRVAPRYPIAGEAVDISVKIQESPQQEYSSVAPKKITRRTRREVSSRPKENGVEGVDVTWAE